MNENCISQPWAIVVAPVAILLALAIALVFAVAFYLRALIALLGAIEYGIFSKVAELAHQQSKLFDLPLLRAFSHK